MKIEVDVVKTVHSARRSFRLEVRFAVDAMRTVLMGPSGAGKSLTLRLVAGLMAPDTGRVRFGGQTLTDTEAGINLTPQARRFGYLFQDYALFPHLSVRQNIAFGLHRGLLNPARSVQSDAVDHWLNVFRLAETADQRPSELSGGQRQRTALARALVNAPQALLLDEPFAALDPGLRDHMRAELDELLARLQIPIVMISHDEADLRHFGERVLMLRDGRIEEAAARS